MIGFMLTSLKVVSIAVEFFASSRRSATRLRRRVIGTRFSLRAPRAGCAAGAAAGAFASAFASEGAFARCLSISSRVRRPPTPVPLMAAGSRLCSASRRRIAGLSASLVCSSRDACWRWAGVDAFSSDFALDSLPALLPSRRRPRIWREVTVVPSSSRTASRMPSAEAGTSSTTLSVSISTSTSSRVTASPGFLCQVATVASATDSGRSGTRISTLLIMYPLINRRSARH